MSQAPGCLGALFPWLFPSTPPTESSTPARALPYGLRDDFLSPAEASFFHVLRQAAGETYLVCPKVNLADLFFVARPNENPGARNHIDRKHVDFVLCDPTTLRPVLAVELDDSSHRRKDRQERDDFVDRVFQAAGLRLVRVPAQASYEVAGLRALLTSPAVSMTHPESAPAFLGVPDHPGAPASESSAPVCPRCGVEMVERKASRGPNAGQIFFGCPNYPRCRHTA